MGNRAKKKRKNFKKFLSNKFIPKYYISIKSQKNVPKSYPTSVNRQKIPRTKILYLSPHATQNQKSIHTFYQIFFPTCAPLIHTVKKFFKKSLFTSNQTSL